MSYKFLEHATDAFIEVTAKDLKEAFLVTANAVINLTLDQDKVEEKDQKKIIAQGKDLRYLLFSWLEEVTFVLITEGFAIKRIELEIQENKGFSVIFKTSFGFLKFCGFKSPLLSCHKIRHSMRCIVIGTRIRRGHYNLYEKKFLHY